MGILESKEIRALRKSLGITNEVGKGGIELWKEGGERRKGEKGREGRKKRERHGGWVVTSAC